MPPFGRQGAHPVDRRRRPGKEGYRAARSVVIPGFQGIANDGSNRVTTLSAVRLDTSAVAVAAAVNADAATSTLMWDLCLHH